MSEFQANLLSYFGVLCQHYNISIGDLHSRFDLVPKKQRSTFDLLAERLVHHYFHILTVHGKELRLDEGSCGCYRGLHYQSHTLLVTILNNFLDELGLVLIT